MHVTSGIDNLTLVMVFFISKLKLACIFVVTGRAGLLLDDIYKVDSFYTF